MAPASASAGKRADVARPALPLTSTASNKSATSTPNPLLLRLLTIHHTIAAAAITKTIAAT